MTLEVMQKVTDELVRRGLNATLEFPGVIALADMHWGDANGTIGCDFVDGSEITPGHKTAIPSDSDDWLAIADAIASYRRDSHVG
jgi:hypothetical protein